MTNQTEVSNKIDIKKTISNLEASGISTFVVETKEEAKRKVLEILPKKAEVLNMTSVSLEEIGLVKEINESGNYGSVRNQLNALDRETENLQMQKLGAAPEWTVGSVHAVTEAGQLVVASNTGSQLAAYVYGSPHVILVVGVQKIVNNLDEAYKRIYDYVLPLESKRMSERLEKSVQSSVSKLLIINKEFRIGRLTLILVKEKLGF